MRIFSLKTQIDKTFVFFTFFVVPILFVAAFP